MWHTFINRGSDLFMAMISDGISHGTSLLHFLSIYVGRSPVGTEESTQIEQKAATPAGRARAEGPGQSEAKEVPEAVPAERVRRMRKKKVADSFSTTWKNPAHKAQGFC